MSEQKKLDSSLENAEKNAPNVEKSANAVENPEKSAEKLSQDELDAVSGGYVTCTPAPYDDEEECSIDKHI